MDRFSFFFAFYGLLLGLAVAELLSGFARLVRARALRKLEARTTLAALFTFLAICATWIDAFGRFENVSLDFAGLWGPIVTGTAYFLAATVIFPTDEQEFERLGDYFAQRQRFIAAMLLVAETCVNISFIDYYAYSFHQRPAAFWLVLVPFNLTINAIFIGLLVTNARRATTLLLAAQVALFALIYWSRGWLTAFAERQFGGP